MKLSFGTTRCLGYRFLALQSTSSLNTQILKIAWRYHKQNHWEKNK